MRVQRHGLPHCLVLILIFVLICGVGVAQRELSRVPVWGPFHFGESRASVDTKVDDLIARGFINDSYRWGPEWLVPLYVNFAGVLMQVGFGFTNDQLDYLYFIGQSHTEEAVRREYHLILEDLQVTRGFNFSTRSYEHLDPKPGMTDHGAVSTFEDIVVFINKGLSTEGAPFSQVSFRWDP